MVLELHEPSLAVALVEVLPGDAQPAGVGAAALTGLVDDRRRLVPEQRRHGREQGGVVLAEGLEGLEAIDEADQHSPIARTELFDVERRHRSQVPGARRRRRVQRARRTGCRPRDGQARTRLPAHAVHRDGLHPLAPGQHRRGNLEERSKLGI